MPPRPIPDMPKLLQKLQGYEEQISHIAWSPDGKIIASASDTIRLWDLKSGQLVKQFGERPRILAWSPNGKLLAIGNYDNSIDLWDTKTWQNVQSFITYSSSSVGPTSIAWSPDSRMLASGTDGDSTVVWNVGNGQILYASALQVGQEVEITDQVLEYIKYPTGEAAPTEAVSSGPYLVWLPLQDWQLLVSAHENQLFLAREVESNRLFWRSLLTNQPILDCKSIACAPNGQHLVAGFSDGSIIVLNPEGRKVGTLEGHTNAVVGLSFSSDGRILASQATNEGLLLWDTSSWRAQDDLYGVSCLEGHVGLAFHPTKPILATLGEEDTVIKIWDYARLFGPSSVTNVDSVVVKSPKRQKAQVRYTNAKVVLVGDSGVGKSGLGLVLSREPFVPTESTHGRRVWTFESREVKLPNGRKETHETLIWDLAGQPSYRLTHQLHLNEVTVALVVFDARSEIDPFAGVDHWDRALRTAQHSQGTPSLPMKKFLVAARADRGGVGVSRARIDSRMRELGFDGYFETSAKTGMGIEELRKAIQEAIDWEALPWVSSTVLFQRIKNFLVAEKEAGRLLPTLEDLYRTFLRLKKPTAETEKLQAQFETCIGRVESRGLIRRLSFGKLVLLQPEMLDAYASALVNVVKDEPDGLGSISEERVQKGNFTIPEDERLKDREQEKLLLIAMIEDLLSPRVAQRACGRANTGRRAQAARN